MIDYTNPEEDVPSPIDLRSEADARAWADAADRVRPWRDQFRARFAELVRELPPGAQVLELGAGPGWLAERILEDCAGVASYTLLDFSEPMLAMSRARLQRFPAARFVLGDFKSDGWCEALHPPYSVVVAMQAVHEIRHKRHVPELYRQVQGMLAPGGCLLVCDHTPKDDSLRWTSLHMTAHEQLDAMAFAGFTEVRVDRAHEGLYLVAARRPR